MVRTPTVTKGSARHWCVCVRAVRARMRTRMRVRVRVRARVCACESCDAASSGGTQQAGQREE